MKGLNNCIIETRCIPKKHQNWKTLANRTDKINLSILSNKQSTGREKPCPKTAEAAENKSEENSTFQKFTCPNGL